MKWYVEDHHEIAQKRFATFHFILTPLRAAVGILYKGGLMKDKVGLLPFYTTLYLRTMHVSPQRASSLIHFNEYSAPSQAAPRSIFGVMNALSHQRPARILISPVARVRILTIGQFSGPWSGDREW